MVSETEFSDASTDTEVKPKKRTSKVEKKSKKPKMVESDSEAKPKSKKSKRSVWDTDSGSDSEVEERPKKKSKEMKPKKRARDSDSEDEKPKKRVKVPDSEDDKPRKRARDSDSEEEKPKKQKKKAKKEESSIDFDELRAYAADIFQGVLKPLTYKDDEVEPKDVKQILTTLMNQHMKLNDELMKSNYVKSVYLVSQVLLHNKKFSDQAPTSTFDEYVNNLDINCQGKWTWPVMNEDLIEHHFNHACETIFLSLYQPKIANPFQEFLSEKNKKLGFQNLLPYVDLSRKKGTVAPQSNGVHAGVGLQGHYCMLAKNIKQSKYEMAYPLIDASLLSDQFRGNPPIKVHCGNNNDQVKLGTIEKFVMIMGGFAEMQVTAGPQSQKLLRQRTLVAVKVGYETNLSSSFKKYLKKYSLKEDGSEEEIEEQ